MHVAYHNGETIVEPTEDKLIKRLFAREGINTKQMKITPDLLGHTAEAPWSLWSVEERVLTLNETLNCHAPIGEFAQEAVLGELEHILKTGPSETPDDVHPGDSDTHTYALDDWLCEHVAIEQFDNDVWDEVRETLHDKLDDEVAEGWQQATDELGNNPARCSVPRLRDYLEKQE